MQFQVINPINGNIKRYPDTDAGYLAARNYVDKIKGVGWTARITEI